MLHLNSTCVVVVVLMGCSFTRSGFQDLERARRIVDYAVDNMHDEQATQPHSELRMPNYW